MHSAHASSSSSFSLSLLTEEELGSVTGGEMGAVSQAFKTGCGVSGKVFDVLDDLSGGLLSLGYAQAGSQTANGGYGGGG
ncbi:MAG: hypothetical protein U0235_01865 [Polyangiaceae bacterium]